MERDNITRVLNLLIGELRIPVTRQSVEEEMAKHPEYQSLLAISDVLNNWRIPNAAYQLNYDELVAAEAPTPFIAHFKRRGGKFVVVHKLDDKQAIVSDESWNKHELSIDEFKDMYDNGSILIAEKDQDSGEPDYPQKRRKERLNDIRIPFVIAGGLAILLTFLLLHSSYISTFNWQTGLLTLFKTIGLVTAILLLVQSIDTNNPLVQKLCGGDNNKDCNAILSSKAAKITDELSWSEIGFFYFAGTWLTLLFNTDNLQVMQALALLNILTLPYTFYSIHHQWRVAKQWCKFCLVVQAVLWLEFFAFVPYLTSGIQLPGLGTLSVLAIGMAIPLLAWVFIKPYFLQTKQIQPLKQQLRQFKYNTDLFNKLINENVKYSVPAAEHSVILGNPEAEHIITMVSNPYCQPCSKAHKALDEWLISRDDIKLQVIFSVSGEENDPKNKMAAHVMALQAAGDSVSLKHALNDWYEQKQKDYDGWAKQHPASENISTGAALAAQREWCKTAEINSTPTIFINGRKLPGNYRTEDIRYFI